jgi:hypothetical protein
MIRNIFHIIVSFALFISTIGFSVSKHYCSGHLIDVSLNTITQTTCSPDGSTCEKDGCCRNESQTFQVHENVTLSVGIDHFPVFPLEIPAFLTPVDRLPGQMVQEDDLKGEVHSPPPRKRSVYLAEIQTYLL